MKIPIRLTKSLTQELLDYKKKVGASYLLEKYLVEPNIKDWYEKRKVEVRASHIMIRPDSTGEAGARNKAQAILDSIKLGKTFEEMVQKYSQDQSIKDQYQVSVDHLVEVIENLLINGSQVS